MVIKTKSGMYHIQRNYRDAFVEEAFVEKYIEECMDKYAYIVGDISSGILRLKGFDTDPKSKNYFGFIDDYLEISCAFGCPYYVLKRINSQEEFEKLEQSKHNSTEEKIVIKPLKKENFDKDTLVLKSTPKEKPNIIIDMNKVNAIPKGDLSPDLMEFVKQDKMTSQAGKQTVQAKPEEMQTYVSASPDFDPTKSNSSKFNRNNNNNNNNNSKNHKNNHKHKNNRNK